MTSKATFEQRQRAAELAAELVKGDFFYITGSPVNAWWIFNPLATEKSVIQTYQDLIIDDMFAAGREYSFISPPGYDEDDNWQELALRLFSIHSRNWEVFLDQKPYQTPNWGFMIFADIEVTESWMIADLHDVLLDHWRQWLSADLGDGERQLFRFWDPRLLPIFLENLNPSEQAAFWRPLKAIALINPDGEYQWFLRPELDESAAPLPQSDAGWLVRPELLDALEVVSRKVRYQNYDEHLSALEGYRDIADVERLAWLDGAHQIAESLGADSAQRMARYLGFAFHAQQTDLSTRFQTHFADQAIDFDDRLEAWRTWLQHNDIG